MTGLQFQNFRNLFLMSSSFLHCTVGKDIPGQASLVFDVALLDLHNPKDGISIENKVVTGDCERRSQSGDFLRYHYNGTLLDGTFFDSR